MVRRCFVLIKVFAIVLLLAACLCGASGAGDAGEPVPINVTARLDRNVITIGDKIRYELEVEAQPGVEFSFPEFGDNLGVFAIKDFGHTPEQKGRDGTRIAGQWYVLDTYVTGTYVIPPATVSYKIEGGEEERGVSVPQLAVRVVSLLEKEGQPTDIRDIKGPVEIPADRRRAYIVAGVIVGAVLAAVLLALLLRKRRRRLEIEQVEMPWETALRELSALKSWDPLKEGRVEEYYVTISGIVRHYLEERFGLRAPEMTTDEFFELMSRDGTLVQAHKRLVNEFLAHCDLVKFARYGPSSEEIDGAYGAAVRLVRETVPEQAEEGGER
jgi:hypothetical protein